MKKNKPTAHPGMAYRGPLDEDPPFPFIREGLWDLYDSRRLVHDNNVFPKLVTKMIDAAEGCYAEGNMAEALLWVWDAGRLWVAYTESAGPKMMRKKRTTTPAGGKAKAAAAWTRSFQTVKAFRRWEARDQAEYLTAKHSADVTGITPETLAKYVREFRKKAQ